MNCPAAGNPVCQHSRATDYTNHGCRCDAARRDRERRRKQQHLLPPTHVPIAGTRRRLQALMVIGWSQNDLNERLGRQRTGSLGPLIWSATRTTVHRDVAARVRDLYDELWETPGGSLRAARAAAGHGWPPPLWWDDDVIDDPTYVYRPVRDIRVRSQRRAERVEEVARLSRLGLSAQQMSERLGVTTRQVVRDRAAIRTTDETAWGAAS